MDAGGTFGREWEPRTGHSPPKTPKFSAPKGMYLRTGGGRLVASIAQFGPQALVGTARMSQKGWQAL